MRDDAQPPVQWAALERRNGLGVRRRVGIIFGLSSSPVHITDAGQAASGHVEALAR